MCIRDSQKTGRVTSVECDDDDYTFYFNTKNGKNGQGYKGLKMCIRDSAYTTQLAKSLSAVRDACPEADVSVQKELILETSDLLSEVKVALAALEEDVYKRQVRYSFYLGDIT